MHLLRSRGPHPEGEKQTISAIVRKMNTHIPGLSITYPEQVTGNVASRKYSWVGRGIREQFQARHIVNLK
jgi:hypothetical protein